MWMECSFLSFPLLSLPFASIPIPSLLTRKNAGKADAEVGGDICMEWMEWMEWMNEVRPVYLGISDGGSREEGREGEERRGVCMFCVYV